MKKLLAVLTLTALLGTSVLAGDVQIPPAPAPAPTPSQAQTPANTSTTSDSSGTTIVGTLEAGILAALITVYGILP